MRFFVDGPSIGDWPPGFLLPPMGPISRISATRNGPAGSSMRTVPEPFAVKEKVFLTKSPSQTSPKSNWPGAWMGAFDIGADPKGGGACAGEIGVGIAATVDGAVLDGEPGPGFLLCALGAAVGLVWVKAPATAPRSGMLTCQG